MIPDGHNGAGHPPGPVEGRLTFRVRYVECDPMGFLHHSKYLPYFEMGRTELLRAYGVSYRELEERDVLFVVTRIAINFKKPARYDDELELLTRVIKQTHVRIDHAYELRRLDGNVLLCTGESTIACINRAGQVQPIPEFLGGKYSAPQNP
ncbi:MAG TPA: thioesterase family protein [Chthoniobacteraceae bacterium]|nr:thioesterase family protein [Phycisphaerae bacterium]HWB58685.1 thioesterase family protein [Chthoniobacteraceae bacterium]